MENEKIVFKKVPEISELSKRISEYLDNQTIKMVKE
jgi:hypothetical protein